jgi:1-acyl-sn-glycerol-3-phosphate acyltransferase
MSTDSFIPPKFNYPFLWFIDFSLKALLKTVHNINEVHILDSDRETLKKLKEERVIYISNHPSTKEPPITYLVGNAMYSRLHYMASREVFDWAEGFVGQVIQNMGAFSVIAGSSDRESLKTTRSILANKAGKLVLFPEGEPTGAENDNLLPFQPGVSQLGFWGYEDAIKQDPKADIKILPAFIKYRLDGSREEIRKDVDRSLERMELYFGISKRGKDIIHRLFSIGKRLIERAEREFGITPDDSENFDYRVGRLRHHILDTVALTVDIKKYNKEDHAIDKLRKLLSTFEMVFVGVPDPKKELPSLDKAKWGRKYCQRVYDFISIQTEYLVKKPTPERIYEWIYRYESELFGSSRPRSQSAYVHFAPIFNISEFYSEYKSDKKKAVESLTTKLRNEIQKLLDREVEKSSILFPEGFTF